MVTYRDTHENVCHVKICQCEVKDHSIIKYHKLIELMNKNALHNVCIQLLQVLNRNKSQNRAVI